MAPEQRMLFWLCENQYTGQGDILDVGCFLGSSSVAMAAGLESNPNAGDAKVLCLDLFKVSSGIKAMFPELLKDYTVDDSFLKVFEEQSQHLAHRIVPFPCDLMQLETLPSKKDFIEIFFIDAAKNPELNNRIMSLGFSRLKPNVSLVIHQDYIFEFCPWIVSSMEYFWEYFEFIDFAWGASFLWRLRDRPIPKEAIDSFQKLDDEQMLELHRKAQDRVSSELNSIGGGTVAQLSKDIITNVMKLSYAEYLRTIRSPAEGAAWLNEANLSDLGQKSMQDRIAKMQRRLKI